jgi:biopolymer transport protein ExbD
MKINLENTADDAQIQIVPMIDVIFCILTFFILAALQLTRQQGINIDLPKASTGAVQMRQMLVVSIDASGQTFIDKNPIDKAQLFTLLKEYRSQNPEGLLVLNASQNAFYNDVIQVLDVLRSVGGDKVALATIPAPSVAPGTNPLNGNLANPSLTPPAGAPGMPTVPGVTNPLLPSTNNPLAPNAPLPPSNYPGVFPPNSPNDPTAPKPTGTGTNPTDAAGVNPTGVNPTGAEPNAGSANPTAPVTTPAGVSPTTP